MHTYIHTYIPKFHNIPNIDEIKCLLLRAQEQSNKRERERAGCQWVS